MQVINFVLIFFLVRNNGTYRDSIFLLPFLLIICTKSMLIRLNIASVPAQRGQAGRRPGISSPVLSIRVSNFFLIFFYIEILKYFKKYRLKRVHFFMYIYYKIYKNIACKLFLKQNFVKILKKLSFKGLKNFFTRTQKKC